MNLPKHEHVTEEQFVRMVKQTDKKLELWNGEIYDMSYTSVAHRDIAEKLFELLNSQLRPTCHAHLNEPIYPPNTTGVYREPDVVVICGERRTIHKEDLELTINPIIIVEVASPSSIVIDHEWKSAEYKSIPSLNHYLIVEQDRPEITLWSRQGDFWHRQIFAGLDAVIELESPKLSLRLSGVYQ